MLFLNFQSTMDHADVGVTDPRVPQILDISVPYAVNSEGVATVVRQDSASIDTQPFDLSTMDSVETQDYNGTMVSTLTADSAMLSTNSCATNGSYMVRRRRSSARSGTSELEETVSYAQWTEDLKAAETVTDTFGGSRYALVWGMNTVAGAGAARSPDLFMEASAFYSTTCCGVEVVLDLVMFSVGCSVVQWKGSRNLVHK